MKKTWYILRFAWKDSRSRVLFMAFALVVCLLIAYWMGFSNILKNYTPHIQLIDGILAVVLIAISFAIWFEQMSDNWKEKQLKLLTVRFYYQGQEVMRCEKATLVGEADIRNWGQQLGKQMSKEFLSFQPNINIEKQPLKYLSKAEGGQDDFAVLYTATFVLMEQPKCLQAEEKLPLVWNNKGEKISG